jgi:DNA polymerase delta subunit 1
MEFQVVSWESGDQLVDGSDVFCIDMFGRRADNRSVSARVSFTPYFFIEVPRTYRTFNVYSDLEKVLPKRVMDEMSIKIVERQKFFGFTNNASFLFANLVFQSKKAWKSAYYVLSKSRKYKDAIYEANIDPMLRFIHLTKIQSAGWVRLEKSVEADPKETSCDVEVQVPHWKHVVPVDNDSIAPIVLASFDIETYSPDGSFPDPEKRDCPVIQIATTFHTYGTKNDYTRHLHTLRECSPIDRVEIHSFDSERDLIASWCELIKDTDPDILVGYNIWKFDNVYLYKRAELLGALDRFCLNRYRTPSRHYKASFSSGAYGDNNYDMVTSQGRFQIDLLELYKRDHKLVKYSLNFVSEHFLGDRKVDMPIKEMFERFRRGTPEDIQKIGDYCVKDTELPLRLMDKLANIPNLVEMARATYVPMNFLIERGQQIKCFSQIAKQTQIEGMLVPTIQDGKSNESFVGATVLEAKKGAYMNAVITGLDFASLYPTIMRAHNLCYNSIVLDEKYNHLPGVEYKTVEWDTGDKHFKYTFAQSPTGILPKLLETLAKNRKQAKKDMANAKDPFMKDVYNGKQLAFKVSMNSIYGFCSAFMLPCQAISACVTTIGREMIEHTKNLVEEWYPGSEVVYGDSVTGDTPLYLENTEGQRGFMRIDDLFYAYDTRPGLSAAKEYVVPTDDMYVFSDQGFTKIKHVMRHKTTKRMYRVVTNAGFVDVTEDHSLLLADGTPVTPGTSVLVGKDLMQNTPPESTESKLLENYTYIHDTHGRVYTLDTKKQAAEIFMAAQAYGYTGTSIQPRSLDVFEVIVRKGPPPKSRVQKVIELSLMTDYVYDIETENHHFHVGPGNLVVHNTDSVMVKFDTSHAKTELEMREISFKLGEEAADRISQTFKRPIELEFEKCYQPYLLFSKKRYAGLMYTKIEKPDYIDAKGIQLVRRDNAPFVKDISKQVLHMIMYDQDVLGSIDQVQTVARRLLNYEIPIDQLIISKSMRNDYANRNQPHLRVAEKIEKRNPGSGPKAGERVPYIIMDNGERLVADRAEDPMYVIEKSLEKKVDVLYYLTNGLISPLESFYDLFMDHSKEGIFGDMIRDFENKRKGLRNGSTLCQFFETTKSKKPVDKKPADKKPAQKKATQRTIDFFL